MQLVSNDVVSDFIIDKVTPIDLNESSTQVLPAPNGIATYLLFARQ
jgi:hypothetical protein